MTTKTFLYTGARVGFTVPIGVSSLVVEARGPWGGGDNNGAAMEGGHVKGTVGVTAGTICYVRVGGRGQNMAKSGNQPLGGFNGGGSGDGGTSNYYGGSAGSGMTDFRYGNDNIASQFFVASGGPGIVGGGSPYAAAIGKDGTASAGGAGGTATYNGTAGTRGQGGHTPNPIAQTVSGYPHPVPPSSGGGAGGYWGGGGGADDIQNFHQGRGGYGSNYILPGATSTTNDTAQNTTSGLTQFAQTPNTTPSLILTYSLPPAAPAAALPFNNSNVDDSQNVTFQWTNPALPEPGDYITGYEIQYREQGDTDWTSLGQVTSASTTVAVDPGNFTGNTQIEWQVRSKGHLTANFGPWSKSYFFVAIAPPNPVNITFPSNGQVFTTAEHHTSWDAVSGQQAWEIRRVADDGSGNPVDTTVYWDSGVNSNALNYITNPYLEFGPSRTEHVQVRVMVNGLWSSWDGSDITVVINIVPPSAPTIVAVPDSPSASITVTVTNTAGGAAVASNDIYRSDPNNAEIRVATGIPPNGSWTDMTPGSGVVYTYRAVAIATNGASTSS